MKVSVVDIDMVARILVGNVLSGNGNSGGGSGLVRAEVIASVYDGEMKCVLIITGVDCLGGRVQRLAVACDIAHKGKRLRNAALSGNKRSQVECIRGE